MSEFTWVVDNVIDQAKLRKRVSVEHDMAHGYRTLHLFETELDALQFMIDRSRKRVEKAKDTLKREQRRVGAALKRLEEYHKRVAESETATLASKPTRRIDGLATNDRSN